MTHPELTVDALYDALEITGIGVQTISGKPYTLGSTSLEDIVLAVNAAQDAMPARMDVSDVALDVARRWQERAEKAEAQLAAPAALECLSTVNTLGGFKGGFAGLHRRAPTEQEIWNAGVRSGLDRAAPQGEGK